MFKYFKYKKIVTDKTVFEFRGDAEDVTVNVFQDEQVVSIYAEDEDAIDALVAQQEDAIECEEIDKDEFRNMVKNSGRLERIRNIVKEAIAKRYDQGDEIAMLKLDSDDDKRKSYDDYVEQCLSIGNKLKEEIGY